VRADRQLTSRCATALTGLASFALIATAAPAGADSAAAPKPTSTAISPGAPDPHPPAGGRGPDGAVPGGQRLAGRGLVLPAGAPALPAGIVAGSWILADLDSGQVLAARDPHGRYQPASILKMLTALTVVTQLPGSRTVTVSSSAAEAEGSAVGLLAGARYSVDDLFNALMLVSGNDAAAALAEANGGIARTVAQMNAKAAQLGAYDTYVQKPSGLDGWQQLTSAYDMALVLRAFVNQPRLVAYDRQASATYSAKASPYGQVGPYQFVNQNQNFLAAMPSGLVAKSGFTDAARHTYLAAAERDGRRLGVVLLRNERRPVDQYQQAAALLNWGYALKPGTEPVGMLAGPIAAAQPATTGAAAERARLAQRQLAADLRHGASPWKSVMVAPVSALLGLWLGGIAVARRRAIRRRARRLH
jgi:serine-type D-Ala-D-Ala carboxypeptidase (penicillin-binding protein 5/6)